MSLYHYLNCHVFKQKLLKVGGSPDPERERERERARERGERRERECVFTKCPVSYVKNALIVNFRFAHSERTTGHLYDWIPNLEMFSVFKAHLLGYCKVRVQKIPLRLTY